MRRRPRRDPQRGNSLLLALIVLSSLATLGSLTVVSVQSSLKSSTNERAQSIALYAAESGVAMTMEFLKARFDENVGWSKLVTQNNATTTVLGAPDLPASGAKPEAPENPFSADQNAWFSVELLNNRNDPNFGAATDFDGDGQIIIRSTGHGPLGSVAIIEWEIRRIPAPEPPKTAPPPPPPPPPWGVIPPGTPLVLVGWHIVL